MAEKQPKRTREELYKQIRSTSRDEFILSEMIRTGFWEKDIVQPTVPEQLINRRGELNREMRELVKTDRKLSNPDLVLKEYRKKKLQESREKQQANRERKEEERIERAKNWKEKQSQDITYIGEDISGGFHETENNTEQLHRFGLPIFETVLDLANAMNLKIGQLRFLAYNRKVSKVSHYKRFYMPKKTGGKRLISAPMPLLKAAQYWVLENILEKVPIADSAHGFRTQHSILTNATPHIGQEVVVNMDFKDFFPSIAFGRVKGTFVNLGYSEKLSSILAALCTEPDVKQVELDGDTFFVAQGPRHLPQGAPTSPSLTNIICYKLDKRLKGASHKLGFNYTRYADDLTFSAKGDSTDNLKKLRWQVRQITKDEGFVLHPNKERIMRKGTKQEVTGLVVNEQLGVDRKTLKKFRALLHQIKQNGAEGKKWGEGKNLAASVWGYAHFVAMVKPQKGQQLIDEVKSIFPNNPNDAFITQRKAKQLKDMIVEEGKKLAKSTEETPKTDGKKDDKKDGDKPKWKLW